MSGFTGIRQRRPAELVDVLRTDFQHRNEPNFAWKSACSAFLALPGLIGFWPMSPVRLDSTTSQCRDLSGMDRNLTNNNTVTFGYDDLAPYANFVAASTQYLNKADGGAGNWADVIGTESHIIAAQRGLTLGGWFYFDSDTGSNQNLLTKRGADGNLSYYLRRSAAGVAQLSISPDGTAANTITGSGASPADSAWYFIAGRFDPSTTIDVWVNDNQTTTAAGVPASIFDSTADFVIGATGVPSEYLDGRASMCFLCSAALSDAIINQLYQWTRAMFGV